MLILIYLIFILKLNHAKWQHGTVGKPFIPEFEDSWLESNLCTQSGFGAKPYYMVSDDLSI